SHEIDTGNILFREEEPIAHEDTAGDLHNRLMVKGARLVLRTVDALASGDYTPIPQEELFTGAGEPKGAPKLFREDMRIDWRAPAEQVRNLIRGLSPWPAAWTMLRHQETGMDIEMKILRVRIGSHVGEGTPPGMLRSDGKKSLEVACGDRWVQITDLQLAGKKRMQTAEFLRGFPHIRNYSAL
ncbi:MAG TPA: methionyl-tRNA formyltransferase, partial [Prolixibacteraceae bacterium]|nr:methionyl-tRNA formyltransferase [Prolixibacteraceae bacterium]